MDSPFLTTKQAAEYLRLSPRTLEGLRVKGGGPPFRKFGSRVVYKAVELENWADSRLRNSTSDPGAA